MVTGRPSGSYQILISLLSALMVATILTSLAGFWKLDATTLDVLRFSAVAVAFAWLCWRWPWAAVATVVVAMVGVTIGAIYLPTWTDYLLAAVRELQEFSAALSAVRLEASFGPIIGRIFLGVTALAAALLILRETLVRGNTFWSIVGGTIVFGTQWAWYFDKSATYFMTYTVLAFAAWPLGAAAKRDAAWETGGRKVGYHSHVATPLAWVLAAAILAGLAPTKFDPVDLGSLGERAQEAFPILKRLRGTGTGGGLRFSLTSTGFSTDLANLGGPVTLDHSVALNLTPASALGQTLYLRGAARQVYTGRGWQGGDAKELKVAENGSLPSVMNSQVTLTYPTYRISPAVNLGNTIFNVLEPSQVAGLKNGFTGDEDYNLWSNRVITRGSTYDVFARLPVYSGDQIRQLSTGTAPDSFAPYLQVPASLPARVGEKARSIASRNTHPYDKAVAIEAYLRGLTYTLEVERTPTGRDFVDYFLFDLQEGYCVYSATAMTVMLRELGIPARFVEGFAVPVTADYTEGADGKRTYGVLNSQAHAWVEAYFPGYGWVTFDPTPRSDLPMIDRSAPLPTQAEPGQTDPGETNTDPTDPNNPEGRDNSLSVDEEVGADGAPIPRELPWALIGLLGVALAAAVWGYRRLRLQDRLAATEDRQVVQEAWSKTSALMNLFGVGRKPHQTAREFAENLGDQWPPLKGPASQVAEDYTVARYGPPNQPLSQEAPERARTLWAQVHETLFARFGWRTYLWRRLKSSRLPNEQ